jgi:hypothetical protein
MAVETRDPSLDGTIVDAEGQVPKIRPKEAKLDESKLEHDQLEHSDPQLHQALTENNAYLYRKDENGSYILYALPRRTSRIRATGQTGSDTRSSV